MGWGWGEMERQKEGRNEGKEGERRRSLLDSTAGFATSQESVKSVRKSWIQTLTYLFNFVIKDYLN